MVVGGIRIRAARRRAPRRWFPQPAGERAQARRPVMDGNPALLHFASALRGSFQAISDHLSIGAHGTTPRSALLKGRCRVR